MKSLRLTIFSAAILMFVCVISSSAQIKVGGYKTVPTDAPEVVEAAEFAANAQSDRSNTTINIETIETAKKQIVAGVNYRICMQVSVPVEGEEPSVQFVQTTVFYSLQQEYSLKGWLRVKTCD